MAQIVSDDFNRANGAIGSNWTNNANGTFTVASNQASSASGAADSNICFTGASWTGGNDQYAEAKIITKASSKDASVMARCATAAETAYFFELNDNDAAVALGSSMRCGLYKVSSGSFTLLGSTSSFTVSSGDVVRIEANGTSITAKLNGTTKFGPTTDSGIASGKPGLNAGNVPSAGSVIFDDFAAGDFSASGGTPRLGDANAGWF